MANKEYEKKYTRPDLREEIKEEIKASGKGGEPGQWSARKSQLLTQEYEKRGGEYKGEKSESQKDLEKWTGEEWQTRGGDANARGKGESGETARYLPKEAWENMSDEEKRETEDKKREGSREGKQFVSNTGEAKKARKKSHKPPVENYDEMNVDDIKKRLDDLSDEELKEIRAYEKDNENRKTLLESVKRKL